MTVETVLPLGVVLDRVEERAAVRRPDDRAGPLGPVGQKDTRSQVLDEKRVLPEARRVERVGQEVPVVAHPVDTDRDECEALAQLVQIERDLFGSLEAPPLPASDR